MGTRRPGIMSIGLAVATLVPACGSGGAEMASPSALGDDAITVTSFDFPESVVLAEIYAQALEAGGYTVERALALGPREFVDPALRAGLVELVPEYAGTASEFASLGAAEPTDDAGRAHAELVDVLAGSRITALAAAPAQVFNIFVVTTKIAELYDLATISDLEPIAGELTFGGPPECAARPLCLAGLEAVYGLRFGEVLVLDTGGPVTRQALRTEGVDVALLFSTDPDREGLVELVDDRRLQPAESVTPLVRNEVIQRWGPEITAVIDGVSRRLTTDGVRALNAAVGRPDATAATVAADWLQDEGVT